MNKNLLSELLQKKLKIFSENYDSNKPPENNKNLNINDHKKHFHEKNDTHNKHKRRCTTNIKKIEKVKLNDNNINPTKHHYRHSLNTNNLLTNNFHRKSQFYIKTRYKSQDKPIKVNLVSQKFKIANDFNEKNSNQFLNEKDECLREVILTDEIEEEDYIHFNDENEIKNILHLSTNKENEVNGNLNNKQIKKIIVVLDDDSESSLTRLIEEIK